MKITYDEHGRFSEIKFDENDDPKAFWENWKEAVIGTNTVIQNEATARAKSYNEETTKQTQIYWDAQTKFITNQNLGLGM